MAYLPRLPLGEVVALLEVPQLLLGLLLPQIQLRDVPPRLGELRRSLPYSPVAVAAAREVLPVLEVGLPSPRLDGVEVLVTSENTGFHVACLLWTTQML